MECQILPHNTSNFLTQISIVTSEYYREYHFFQILHREQSLTETQQISDLSDDSIAVFRISFCLIRELPIKSNPNCSVNWLTAQKVKKGKISSIFCNPIGQFSAAICKAIPGL